MNNGKISSIQHFKYAGKFLVCYTSPEGKFTIKRDRLTEEENAFLADAKKRGAVYNCMNLAIYA